jgi:hypothetical protein
MQVRMLGLPSVVRQAHHRSLRRAFHEYERTAGRLIIELMRALNETNPKPPLCRDSVLGAVKEKHRPPRPHTRISTWDGSLNTTRSDAQSPPQTFFEGSSY